MKPDYLNEKYYLFPFKTVAIPHGTSRNIFLAKVNFCEYRIRTVSPYL